MKSFLIIVCHKCGGFLLAKAKQKTRTCPYCGATVFLEKAKKIASASDANEASMILRKLKSNRKPTPELPIYGKKQRRELDYEMIKIRPYESRDFNDYVKTLEKTTNFGVKAEEELRARIRKMKIEEEIWVAEIDKRPVGFMILSPNYNGTLEIDWLDVNPEYQRRGIATHLVNKAETIAKNKNIKALSVHTHVENIKMIMFLRKKGFKVFERVKNFYGKGKDALRFNKLLL